MPNMCLVQENTFSSPITACCMAHMESPFANTCSWVSILSFPFYPMLAKHRLSYDGSKAVFPAQKHAC